nr:hypothetical protein GCM10020241_32330 [Streptoalloteichus tenebrarius]
MTDRAGGDGPRGEDATGDDRPDLSGQDPAEAFGRLFDQHARPLHRYLARRVGEHVADDLVAETFLVALRQRHDYDPARAPVRAWLFGIATNLLRRHVRQEIRGFQVTAMVHGRAEAERPEPPETRAIERVDAEERTRRLAEALGQMAQGDRDVLLLTSWGGHGLQRGRRGARHPGGHRALPSPQGAAVAPSWRRDAGQEEADGGRPCVRTSHVGCGATRSWIGPSPGCTPTFGRVTRRSPGPASGWWRPWPPKAIRR